MKIEAHTSNQTQIAEIISDHILINNASDGLNLLGELYYQGFDCIVLHEKNITPGFFHLANGMAGELLQKFSNYRVCLAIVGNFSAHKSTSLMQFMLESNRAGHINFVSSTAEALLKLTKAKANL
ncbi:MAG: DUF4180 domain-containing protein [Cyclobacteriaceae bacterium]|nr:DUF4180 domain-containing protein [Cyclobacteriaceae bacterium]